MSEIPRWADSSHWRGRNLARSFLYMVTRRARSVFGLCLAIALLPLMSMAVGGRDARAQASMAWMQLQAKSQASAQLARTGHTQTDARHQPFTPFAPAAPFSLALSTTAPATTTRASSAYVAVGATKLHRARAPPALS